MRIWKKKGKVTELMEFLVGYSPWSRMWTRLTIESAILSDIQLDIETQISYDITHMWILKKKWYKQTYLQNRNRVKDVNTNLRVPGGTRVRGKLGDWDWHKHAAAAAAKSLQSCPTLCDPIDGSPPGSAVPGILQARTLEWVAISFSNKHTTIYKIDK